MGREFYDLYFFKNLENSNDKIKEFVKNSNSSDLAVFCINQTKGRGRRPYMLSFDKKKIENI